MRALRRLLQVVALVGTLMVGIVAIALIVSQTPWFRDWMRRYIVRESKQYLNGELSIGAIGGNLLFGVQVNDIAVDVSGERVIAAKGLEVDYSIFEIVSKGVVINEIKLVEPVVKVARNGNGWTLAQLVKKQEKEADRQGPRAPLALQSIEIADASVIIDDAVGTSGYRLPQRIDDLDLKASYAYEPVRYSLVVDRASARTSSPQFALTALTGKISVRDDNVYIDDLAVSTSRSSMTIDGVIEDYLKTPIVKLTTTGNVSLPELGRFIPAAAEYPLNPRFTLKATGPAETLALDVALQSEAGNVRGQLTADVKMPAFAARGDIEVERLDLAPLLKNPAQRSDITGRASIDFQLAAATEGEPFVDRISGTFKFQGPSVTAAGYSGRNVRASGMFDDGRITFDGEAAAYGGTATARGFIRLPAGRRPLELDLRGKAENVDLRNLPARLGVPALETDLSVAEYEVSGMARALSGRAVLNRSIVEGATFSDGTVATFSTASDRITYSARGSVTGANLPRMGKALEIAALQNPAYDGQLNGDFDVAGELARNGRSAPGESRIATVTIDAKGTLRDSTVVGGRLPQLGYEAHMSQGALTINADGRFEHFNPATLTNRATLDGDVTGTLRVNVKFADLTAPITPETLDADGVVALEQSLVRGLQIEAANVEGKYAAQVADLTRLQVKSPDLQVEASGRVALDRMSESTLKYHVESADLLALAQLAGQENVRGAVTLDGAIAGNAASLRSTGLLNGSNVAYGDNSALDVNSTYTVTLPEFTPKNLRVEADTTATFIKAGGLQLNEVTAKTTFEGERLNFTTNIQEERRELDATGQLILHPDHQEVHLPRLAIRTEGIEWTNAPGVEATVKYGQSRVEIDKLSLVSGSQALDVSGVFALKGDAQASDIKIQAKNVDLRQLETLMLMDRGLSGTLSADATIKGTAESPVIEGRVAVVQGGFQAYKYESLTADVDYQGTRISLNATLQQSATESITAKGAVPTSLFRRSPGGHVEETEADRIDLRITSSALGLGLVQGFTNQITNVAGTVQADVHVTGSGGDPHVAGFVDVKNGAFAVPAGGVSYSGLNTRIELEPDVVRIEKFAIVDEHGERLNVSGDLAVHEREVGAVNISLESDNFEIIDNELGDVGIDSSIKITGELRRPKVEGTVRLEAARLEVDKILALFYDPYAVEALPDVVSAERSVEGHGNAQEATRSALQKAQTTPIAASTAPARAGQTAGGAFAPVELDVRLVIPDNLVLRGRQLRPGGPTAASIGDVNITVGGNLQVVKPANGHLLLLGTVETVRGTYAFQSRRFDLQRGGSVRFLGEPDLNPALDVTATRVIPNTGIEARVRILGTAKAPQLSLSSDPPLDESDVLALIVFNRPVNELGTGERASLAATAGGIATGFLAAPLGESIGRALDLDLFEITTTTEEGDLGAGLTLGQQIGDRAFLKMRQQFGDRNLTEFLVEYQLTNFLRLHGNAAPETSGSANRIGQRRVEKAGIDLIFFFSY